jgi:hypothetical protein
MLSKDNPLLVSFVSNLSSKSSKQKFLKVYGFRPGTVAHTYNPSYSAGGDREGHDLRPAQAKTLVRPHSPHLNQ